MPVSVTMPRLGESVTEGTVTRWLKQEGERVEADEPLLEVSTDKVDTEIPSPAAGVLSRIVVGEDETADVGSELAIIAGDGEDAGSSAPAPAEDAQQAAPEAEAEPEPEPEPAALDTPSTEKPVEEEAPAPQTAAPAGGSEGTAVKMPALGESVTEGTVTRWLKQVGDTIEVDEPLLEVSTDKVDTEIPSPVAGTVLEIKVPEDETADVGAELAIIGTPGDAPAAAPAPSAPAPQQAEAPKAEAPKAEAPTAEAPKAEAP
ncbi:biotin/lipoyl-containing protein, partial [Actinoplanes sp. NPDC048791]|uniref:biotin/lipoyl-containing protein n=1 Tax=Actinoplanes sp. NPDC048791 TaxID=3154623 RepID=UPI00340EC3AF